MSRTAHLLLGYPYFREMREAADASKMFILGIRWFYILKRI